MPAPLEIATRNFVGHYQAIPSALGSPGTERPYFSTSQHTFDIPYPNGITYGVAEYAQTRMVQIQQLLAGQPSAAETGAVDSYSNLGMQDLGFGTKFDTPWSFREPAPRRRVSVDRRRPVP